MGLFEDHGFVSSDDGRNVMYFDAVDGSSFEEAV